MPQSENQDDISLCVRKISLGQLFIIVCALCVSLVIKSVGITLSLDKHDISIPSIAIEQQTKSYQNIPNIILRIGPGKSGTTTIQRGLETMEVKGLILIDNYTLINHIEISNTARQGREIKNLKNVFQNMVSEEEMWQPKQHMFGSSEFIHDPKECNCMEWNNLKYTSYSSINEKNVLELGHCHCLSKTA